MSLLSHPSTIFKTAPSISEVIDLAEKNSPAAQYYLAFLYQNGGRGVQPDLDKAVEWAKKAITHENTTEALEAANILFVIYSRDYPEQKRNRGEAEKWLKFQADRGDVSSSTLFGMRMLGIYGGPARPEAAFPYLKRAAEGGDGNAIYWLGECYANGWGVASNADQAIQNLKTASNMEPSFLYKPVAQRKLAEAYKYGYGVSKNQKTAADYFEKSAYGGDTDSMIALARAYLDGQGVVPSDAMTLVWVYVNRACGGSMSDGAVNMLEGNFSDSDLALIRKQARQIVAEIESRKAKLKTGGAAPPPDSKTASGTGVIVSSEGLVVTAAHVVEDAKIIEVRLPGGNRPASVVEIDEKNDLAILRIGGSGYRAAALVPSRDVKLGQSVFTIGFPNTDIQGASPKFTKGEISSLSGMRDEPTQWQISVPVQSGNSGSPLFDESGNVVGIVVSKLNALETAQRTGDLVQNVNYAVKNAYLIPLLEKFSDKLPPPKKRGIFQKLESTVEDSKESVVLILAY